MISPIENTGMIMRTQDFSAVRHNEDNHSANVHVQIQERMDKADEANAHTVIQKDNADSADTRHDARDEGRNKYFSTRKKKQNDDVAEEGVVVVKRKSGFDITI